MRKCLFHIILSLLIAFGSICNSSVFAADNLAGTYGTEFWLAFLSNKNAAPEDLTITFYAVAEEPMTIAAYVAGNKISDFTLDEKSPNYLYKLENVSATGLCPVDNESEQIKNRGIRIASNGINKKFSCYALIETGGKGDKSQRDATLILPKEVLGKEYFVQTNYDDGMSTEFAVVATEAETQVTIVPSCKTYNNVDGGTPISITLNAGEVYMVKSQTKKVSTDIINLSGSSVCANKPVAVFNGNEMVTITTQPLFSASHTFEQTIPQNLWGTDFYLGLTGGGTKRNVFNVTSAYDKTKVTLEIYNRAKNTVDTQEETIEKAGGSLSEPVQLVLKNANQQFTDVYIHSDKPTVCFTYLTCGGYNIDDDDNGWGNPANAMVVPWSHRAKEMSFYTDSIENQHEGALQHHFVQIVTDKADDGKIVVDGTTLTTDAFKTFGANSQMVYANYELKTHGKHHISTVGQGFTGFVYGLTAEGRAYEYTLGFDPPKFVDSLFLANPEPYMSRKSYYESGQPVLPYMDNKGWYQRQPYDFPIGKERIDTMIVCDSTQLDFRGLLASQNSGDSVMWKIYLCDDKGIKVDETKPIATFGPKEGTTSHTMSYKFTVDPQLDKEPEERDPFTFYSVDMEKYKRHLICDLDPDADTLRTMVRVNRVYNDTIWRIVCETDTLKFFQHSDSFDVDLGPSIPNKRITFVAHKSPTAPDTVVQFTLGKPNVWSRRYHAIGGCDSTVTLVLFGCDTTYLRVDTTLCENAIPKSGKTGSITVMDKNGVPRLINKIEILGQDSLIKLAKKNQLAPYTKTYGATGKNKGCISSAQGDNPKEEALIARIKQKCKDFKGCLDSVTVNITIKPLLYFENTKDSIWCTGGDPTAVYNGWKWANGDIVRTIYQTDPEFDHPDERGVCIFRDTIMYCDGCANDTCIKEISVLKLIKVDNEAKTSIVHICQDSTYTHKAFMPADQKLLKGWELGVGTYTETHTVEYKDDLGHVLCSYDETLELHVHPAYVNTSNLTTWKESSAVICKKELPYKWTQHETNTKVWLVAKDGAALSKPTHIDDPSSISLPGAGVYEFIDSLRTTTCTECKGEACDSIWHFTLTVGEEYHKVDSFGLCRNGVQPYKYGPTTYYYHGSLYTPTDEQKPTAKLVDDTWLNETCTNASTEKIYEEVFDTYPTIYGCDSVHTLKIHLNKTDVTTVDTTICETDTYDFLGEQCKWAYDHDNPANNTHVKTKTTKTDCGCDNYVTHTIHVRPAYNNSDNPEVATVCQWLEGRHDESAKYFKWTDHPRDGEPRRKIYMINTKSSKGDSVWTDQIPTDTLAGTYKLIDALRTTTCPKCKDGSCDSTTVMLLTINPSYDNIYRDTLSDKETLAWDGVLFAGPKAVIPPDNPLPVQYPINGVCEKTIKYTTALGCDTFMTYRIVFGETYYFPEYDFVCENCSYTWRDHVNKDGTKTPIIITDVPQAGETKWYYDEYKTVLNFDSVFAIQLTGFPTKHLSKDSMVCQGEPFTWLNHPGQPAKHDQVYLFNDKGEFISKIGPDYVFEEYGSYMLVDSMLTDTIFLVPGTTSTKQVQCDSIWTLYLTVNPTYSYKYNPEKVTHDITICSNETLLWSHRLWVGYDYDNEAHPLTPASNTTDYDSIVYIVNPVTMFFDSVPTDNTIHNCDSISYIRIHINAISPASQNMYVHHIGDNDSIWSFGGNDKTQHTLPLVTRETLVPSATIDYKDVNRHEIKKFFFIDTLRTSTDCDSIVWDSVYIHPSYRIPFDTVICSNCSYTKPCWAWRPESPNASRFVEMNHRHPGYYYDSLKTEASLPYQFDSVFVLELGIEPGAELSFERDMCKNDTTFWEQKKVYYQDNFKSITVTYQTAHCDSILTLNLNFFDFNHFPVDSLKDIDGYGSDSICRYDTIIWITPGETTPHTKALRGEKGEKFAYVPTDTLGWITVYDSLHTSAPCHCDSTYTLRYYVKPSYRFYDTLTICSNDTLEWRGQILFSDTATILHPKDSYQTTGGSCDSIYYLTLYVNQAYDSTRYDTICGNVGTFRWEGHNLDSWLKVHENDTLPVDTFLYTRYPTEHLDYGGGKACDSIFRLYLNVRPILTTEWNDTICIGETYTLNSKTFTTTGVYTDTLTNRWGCDTFAVVHLEVVPATVFKVEPLTVCADSGMYDLTFTFDTVNGYMPRTVRIVYDSLAQANGFPEDTVELTVTENVVEVELPGSELDYVQPNNYTAKVYFDNGTCDDPEMQRVDILLTVEYPSKITEQKWSDAIGILNAKYNGGYTFSAYQWYKNGEKLVGKTDPYLFEPDYLEIGAEYKVMLTRKGDTIGFFTCPIIAQKRDSSLTPQKPYVSVVPTYVVKENPVVHILCSQHGGEFKLFDPYGSLIQTGRFEPGNHNAYEVRLPSVSGLYLFELIQDEGERRTIKVLVN